MSTALAASNSRADQRAVAANRRARFDAAAHCFLVKSESQPGVDRHVSVDIAASGALVVRCDCDHGRSRRAVPGLAGCRHGARLLRRLRRLGWAALDNGMWIAAPKALDAVAVATEAQRQAEIAKGKALQARLTALSDAGRVSL